MEQPQNMCLECFALLPPEARTCPVCGQDQTRLGQRSYGDKLLHALGHPLPEVRMRAIIALGWRGEAATVGALVDHALRHPVDVVEGLEIVRSLRLIEARNGPLGALEKLAALHPARAVRTAAGGRSGWSGERED